MSLNSHLERVEKHGFDRGVFPVSYHGHNLKLLQNDGHETSDDRLLFHFTLYCTNCERECGISGRLPPEDEHMEYHIVVAKVASFGEFTEDCTK